MTVRFLEKGGIETEHHIVFCGVNQPTHCFVGDWIELVHVKRDGSVGTFRIELGAGETIAFGINRMADAGRKCVTVSVVKEQGDD